MILSLLALCKLPYCFVFAEFKAGSEISMSDIKKNFQSLYEYNVMLREKLVSTESMLQSLTTKASSSGAESEKNSITK